MMVAGDFAVRQNDARGFGLLFSSGWNLGDALDEHVALSEVCAGGCFHFMMDYSVEQ